ncbi:hypothetical protein ACHWQZ_G016256 [Mnemiopsis leidyi]
MKAFFTDTVSAVRVNGDLTDWFSVNSGTGQGDIQGPPVFNFCLNFTAYLMEHEKVVSKGMVLELPVPSEGNEGKHLLDTDYADDMALLDNTVEGLQETTDLLCKNSAYAGLKVNAKKTQCMAVSKSASQRPYTQQDTLDLTVEGQPIEQEERRLSAVSVESLRRKVFSQGREVRPGKMEMVDLMFIDDLV